MDRERSPLFWEWGVGGGKTKTPLTRGRRGLRKLRESGGLFGGGLNGQDLTAFVVAARRAGYVSWDGAAAFWTGFEERSAPAG
jgi:hypothetical protein